MAFCCSTGSPIPANTVWWFLFIAVLTQKCLYSLLDHACIGMAASRKNLPLYPCLLHDVGYRHIHSSNQPRERQHRNIIVSALDAANVTAIYISTQRQIFLRNSSRNTRVTNSFAESHQQRVLSVFREIRHIWMVMLRCAGIYGTCTSKSCAIRTLISFNWLL